MVVAKSENSTSLWNLDFQLSVDESQTHEEVPSQTMEAAALQDHSNKMVHDGKQDKNIQQP